MTERKFCSARPLRLRSVERSSLERGATLLEMLFVLTAAMLFALGVFVYFFQTSTQWSLIETQDDLSRAIRDVQDSYPSHIFRRIPSADLREAVRDKTAPLGEINALRSPGDPSDAFRVTLSDIPSADQNGLCASLLERMLKAPHTDAGRCLSPAGASASEMEIRVRREQNPDLWDLPFQYLGIPDCINACDTANWRGPMPTREEMLTIKDTLEMASLFHSASDSCDTSTKEKFNQCLSVQGMFVRSLSGQRYMVDGYGYTTLEYVKRNYKQLIDWGLLEGEPIHHLHKTHTGRFPLTVRIRIDRSVYDILKDYVGYRENGNLPIGYRGIGRMSCELPPRAHQCSMTTHLTRMVPTSVNAWWVKRGDQPKRELEAWLERLSED